jgi:aspartyl/asparaginyl beta-hydroxylase (cupin superfamily)
MSSPQFEAFLARLYADPVFLERFLGDPGQAMQESRLTPHEARAAASIDRASLLLAAHSYARKREARGCATFFERVAQAARRAAGLAMHRLRGFNART